MLISIHVKEILQIHYTPSSFCFQSGWTINLISLIKFKDITVNYYKQLTSNLGCIPLVTH